MLARIRKALVAGLGAGASAALGTLTIAGAPTRDDVQKAIGAGIVAVVVVGWATYRVPNKPAA